MYNIDFLPQLEEARKHLWGPLYDLASVDSQAAADVASRMPLNLNGVKFVSCHEDTNGEWVLDNDSLEEAVSE